MLSHYIVVIGYSGNNEQGHYVPFSHILSHVFQESSRGYTMCDNPKN